VWPGARKTARRCDRRSTQRQVSVFEFHPSDAGGERRGSLTPFQTVGTSRTRSCVARSCHDVAKARSAAPPRVPTRCPSLSLLSLPLRPRPRGKYFFVCPAGSSPFCSSASRLKAAGAGETQRRSPSGKRITVDEPSSTRMTRRTPAAIARSRPAGARAVHTRGVKRRPPPRGRLPRWVHRSRSCIAEVHLEGNGTTRRLSIGMLVARANTLANIARGRW